MNPTELSPSTKIFELALRNQTFTSKEKALGFLHSLGSVIQVSRECRDQFSTDEFLNLMICSIGHQNLAMVSPPDMQAAGWNPRNFLKTRLRVLNNWVFNLTVFELGVSLKVTPFCALYQTSQKIDVFMLCSEGILRASFNEDLKGEPMKYKITSFEHPRMNCPGFFASCEEWHATVNAHNLIRLISENGKKLNIKFPEIIEIQQIELNQEFLFIRYYNTENKTQSLSYSKYQTLEQKNQAPPKILLSNNTTWLHVLKNELLFIEKKENKGRNYFYLSSTTLDQAVKPDSSISPRCVWKMSDQINFPPFILSSNDMLFAILVNDEGRLFINRLKICSEKIELCEISSPIYQDNQMILREIWSAAYHLDKIFIYGLMENLAIDGETQPIVIFYDLETQKFSKPNLVGSNCMKPDVPFFDSIIEDSNQNHLKISARFFPFDNDKISLVYPRIEANLPETEDQQFEAPIAAELVLNILMLDNAQVNSNTLSQAESAPNADSDTPLMLQ